MPITIATFYQFVAVAAVEACQQQWQAYGDRVGLERLRGTIYVASEGLNATLASSEPSVLEAMLAELQPYIESTPIRYSTSDEWPFQRWRVRQKREIVSMGTPNLESIHTAPVHSVTPSQWNQIIQKADVQVIDTRNDYEVAIGTFVGATDPQTQHFREFPDFARSHLDPKRPVAMFCTGGIRCSKATAWLHDQGFEDIYQLEGGILNYLQNVPASESLWQGECFVFDERVALSHGLKPGHYQLCEHCGRPIAKHGNCTHCSA